MASSPLSPATEPVRSNALAAGVVAVIAAIVSYFGFHLSAQVVSIITAVVGLLAPVVAGEMSRLKVTPSIKLPSATLRQDLPLLGEAVQDLTTLSAAAPGASAASGASVAPSEADLATLAEQVLSGPAVSPPAAGV